MKLAIGTAQWGGNYGISNKILQTPVSEIKKILTLAKENGIRVIHASPEYGKSLNKILSLDLSDDFNIIVKRKGNPDTLTYIIEGFYDSNITGHSIYHDTDITPLIESGTKMIQLPLNVFDQSAIKNGLLRHLKTHGVDIHVRSIFLQGLLLMNHSDVFRRFPNLAQHFAKYERYVNDHGVSKLEYCLQFVKNIPEVDYMVVGIASAKQLEEILEAYHHLPTSKLSIDDLDIIDPRRWKDTPKQKRPKDAAFYELKIRNKKG